jgi:hypothetical protein
MNIRIKAVGKTTYPSGLPMDIVESFGCYQTPTHITNSIMDDYNNGGDPIQVYKDWFMGENGHDVEEDIYDDVWDDQTNYFKIIGKRKVNIGEIHCKELDEFLDDVKKKGLEIIFYSM